MMNKINLEYDANGNVTHGINQYGAEYWQEYDAAGNVIHYKNVLYEYWKEYDSEGRIIREIDSDKTVRTFDYDEKGLLIHNTGYNDGEGGEIWYGYDNLGRLIYRKYSTGFEEHWELDDQGRVIGFLEFCK